MIKDTVAVSGLMGAIVTVKSIPKNTPRNCILRGSTGSPIVVKIFNPYTLFP